MVQQRMNSTDTFQARGTKCFTETKEYKKKEYKRNKVKHTLIQTFPKYRL